MSETKNEYEIRREEKEKAREKERAQANIGKTGKSLVRYGLWVAAIIIVGYGITLLARSSGPQGEDFSIAYPSQGGGHIAVGSAHEEYSSNPPSSGSHYTQTAQGGFYDEPLPDEQVVHNLEHGDIWIAYHPDISEEVKGILESFAGRYVVVSPRNENEGDISLVAWGRVDTFDIEGDIVDQGRIKDFIRRYDNRGPENVRQVQFGHGGF